jgi:tRNA (guanine10-N2)-methyltransferase
MLIKSCQSPQVKRGDFVYDPFAGTGSMLVAAAHHGASTLGADIDIRVIRDGKPADDGSERDNWSNFQSYGLPPPVGLLRADAHRPPFRDGLEV